MGKGIAGTVMALQLVQQNKTVLVIDENAQSSASKIAAGLVNPIVFKRMVKSWMMDETLPAMMEFYTNCEKLFAAKFFSERRIVKIFAEEQEVNFWNKKRADYHFLSEPLPGKNYINTIETPFGYAFVNNAAHLEVVSFLNHSHNYLQDKCELVNEKFDYNQIKFLDDEVTYKNYRAKKIIFCEGHKAMGNPFFNYAQFKLTKGELLELSIKQMPATNDVLNKNVFLLPHTTNNFTLGATYNWTDLTEEITTDAKNDLLNKLGKIISLPIEVISQRAGIRPAVADRRPLLGLHREHKQLVIFNGLGTKGVLYAPYFAQQLVSFLENKKPLPPEVDVNRFA